MKKVLLSSLAVASAFALTGAFGLSEASAQTTTYQCADDVFYHLDNSDPNTVYSVDPETGATTLVNQPESPDSMAAYNELAALESDEDGAEFYSLLGATGENKELYRLNPDGTTTPQTLGTTTLDSADAFGGGPSGNLYALADAPAGTDSQIYEIDPSDPGVDGDNTGAVTGIETSLGDMAVRENKFVYLGEDGTVYEIDRSEENYEAVSAGDLTPETDNTGDQFTSLTYIDDTYYALQQGSDTMTTFELNDNAVENLNATAGVGTYGFGGAASCSFSVESDEQENASSSTQSVSGGGALAARNQSNDADDDMDRDDNDENEDDVDVTEDQDEDDAATSTNEDDQDDSGSSSVSNLRDRVSDLQALIASLQDQLNGQAGSSEPEGDYSVCSEEVFLQDLSSGMENTAVMRLQEFLNQSPVTQVAESGPGSPGQETMYYGSLTTQAVSEFQAEYAQDILGPLNLTSPTGYWGANSRETAREVCSQNRLVD